MADLVEDRERLRVLFVVDRTYWVTAAITRRIIEYNSWIDPIVLSPAGLSYVLRWSGGRFPAFVDVVHFLTPHLATEYEALFRPHAPYVVTIHHIEDAKSTAPAAAADAVMTVCDEWHEALIASGVSREKCIMVRNTADPEIFLPPTPEDRYRARAAFGVGQVAFCIGYCGKQSSNTLGRKGIETFIAAAEQVAARFPQVAFLVLGPGWAELQQAFAERGLTFVYRQFIPDSKEVVRFYQALDMFWVTSRIEGGPVPLLEAMATGVPSVSTPVGIAPAAIKDGGNGFLVGFDAPGDYVDRATRLIDDPVLSARLGAEARRTIVEQFAPSQVVLPIRDLYRVARSRFAGRSSVQQTDKSLTAAARTASIFKHAQAREHLDYMRFLLSVNERRAAVIEAAKAVACAPLDRSVWRTVLRPSPRPDQL